MSCCSNTVMICNSNDTFSEAFTKRPSRFAFTANLSCVICVQDLSGGWISPHWCCTILYKLMYLIFVEVQVVVLFCSPRIQSLGLKTLDLLPLKNTKQQWE